MKLLFLEVKPLFSTGAEDCLGADTALHSVGVNAPGKLSLHESLFVGIIWRDRRTVKRVHLVCRTKAAVRS